MAPPTACNRSAGPAVKPVPVRPRHVIDAFGSVSYPRIPLRRPAILSFGGVPLVLSSRMRRPPRAQRERGCPRRPPGSPGRGLMSIPRPPGTSRRGPTATSRARPRWPRSPFVCGIPRAIISSRRRRASRTPSSRASLSRGARRSPWASASAGGRPGHSTRTPRQPAS